MPTALETEHPRVDFEACANAPAVDVRHRLAATDDDDFEEDDDLVEHQDLPAEDEFDEDDFDDDFDDDFEEDSDDSEESEMHRPDEVIKPRELPENGEDVDEEELD